MLEALRALQAVAARLLERGRGKEARGVLASARVLLQRLDLRVVAAL
jgi:C4-dicarboxylate-specific signal transduction histidine kinase